MVVKEHDDDEDSGGIHHGVASGDDASCPSNPSVLLPTNQARNVRFLVLVGLYLVLAEGKIIESLQLMIPTNSLLGMVPSWSFFFL